MRPPRRHRKKSGNPGHSPHEEKQPPTNAAQPASHQQSERPPLNPSATSQPAEEQQRCADERRFWERQIRVAKWLNGITMGGAAVALFGLLFLYLSIIGADDATVRANRAWIAPRGASLDFEHTSKTAVWIKVEFENIGRDPATDVTLGKYVGDFMGPAIIKDNTLPIKDNTTCRPVSLGNAPVWPIKDGPKDSTSFMMDDKEFLGNFPAMLSGIRTLYIEGCFSYMTFGKERHSAFCYYLKPREVVAPDGIAKLQPDGNVAVGTNLQFIFGVCPNP